MFVVGPGSGRTQHERGRRDISGHYLQNARSYQELENPVLAHMQIKTGGTVGGVCVAKVAEAEVMVEGGIEDIFITNQVVSEDKIVRLCSLAAKADMRVAIDNPENLRLLSKNASNDGVTVGVVIEVDTSMHRAGIRTVEAGVELAQLSQSLPGLRFKGVMSHQTVPGDLDRETRYIEGRHFMQDVHRYERGD